MESIGIITFYGLIFGMVGTTFGGLLGAILNITSKKILSFILELSAGLMTAIICFDLIPESLEIINISECILGIFFGIIMMIICNKLVHKYCNNNKSFSGNNLLKTGIIMSIGLAVHNFPEGLAIGAGFGSSTHLGFALATAIALHDVPEGISISLPLKIGGVKKSKTIMITAISGLFTGIGAFFGAIIGNISKELIGLSLAFAAGAMLYIVSCELVPESKKLYSGRFPSVGNIFGLVIGIISKSI